MKFIKLAGPIALAVLAIMGLTAAGASATTLEVGGVTKNSSIEITGSLQSGTSLIMKDTAGFVQKTCLTSHFAATTTSPFTGSSVTGPMSTWSFTNCTRAIIVHKPGKIEFTYTSGTNGTVASEEYESTTQSSIGTLNCKTGATTSIGTLTGAAAGNAILDINAVTNCGIVPSAKFEATYSITSPSSLGVSS